MPKRDVSDPQRRMRNLFEGAAHRSRWLDNRLLFSQVDLDTATKPLHYQIQQLRAENERLKAGWRPISSAPKDGTEVLIYHEEGVDLGHYRDRQEDAPDDMGHDAGWFGVIYAAPGRSFGNPKYFREAQGQPIFWMPLPEAPST